MPDSVRCGWTTVASGQAPNYPAGNVLDGNAATIWHSRYAGTQVPLPHHRRCAHHGER
jgi:galactose oxidase